MPVTMIRTEAFLPLIMPFAPKCPRFLVEQQVRFVAIDFCERSRAWRHVTTVAMTGSEAVPVAPDTAAIHEIEFAEFEGKRLTPIQFSVIASDAEGAPRYVAQASPNALIISPFTAGDLKVSMFLKPLASSAFGGEAADPLFDRFNVVPDFLLSIHGATIAAGALAKVLAIPDEPWSNAAEGLRYRAEFEMKADTAFRWNMRGQQRAPIRTRYRDF